MSYLKEKDGIRKTKHIDRGSIVEGMSLMFARIFIDDAAESQRYDDIKSLFNFFKESRREMTT